MFPTATRLAGLGVVAAVAVILPVPTAQAAPAPDWQPCSKVANGWPDKDDTTTECAELRVPLDYGEPDGRQTTIAISRRKASDPAKRRGAIFLSPGGPGLPNITAPRDNTDRRFGVLNTEYDFLGMDPRGTGHSEKHPCAAGEFPPPPPNATRKEREKVAFDHQAQVNKRCFATDPEFYRQLTPSNVARDLDRVREAVGERKLGFYGVSFGTTIGQRYRALFDSRVDRMWLDSGMPPTLDHAYLDESMDVQAQNSFRGFTAWLADRDREYHFGRTPEAVRTALFALREELTRNPRVVGEVRLDGDWVRDRFAPAPSGFPANAGDLATARDGGTPAMAAEVPAPGNRPVFGLGDPRGGMEARQYDAMLCNEGIGGSDFDTVWATVAQREQRYPGVGGGYLTYYCAGWPVPQRSWQPVRGESPLQSSGHRDESTTPHPWTVATRDAVGGGLLTVLDGAHGSLSRLPCVAKVVDFFHTGRTVNTTCPGVQ
ncbi:pimeloyl-ACP methyl ester carboxylesterase [Crossiella equi]|uniref:Pimeloyl-ACP methyl ester carboxylesterase n=1 Tax=Crossiella equi TaxID=130796 RepID=A0ABS5AQ08_9PSEU|nr:alpha/beta fold hydrolase [Crossiella equi]MBP2478646.1 pimeloyl-ACP methyl ester carboxylesterase [Crossiella equi]